ncbi:hypothetical protein AC630_11840 [Bradyrhizobium sp. AS23.2]|nr:hypothetical protein [Bradyrhizobium sp. AS23.2]OKO83010.1 hypothetical protein AC630_11840 [Bradyrhizobium sp. AS23.2]
MNFQVTVLKILVSHPDGFAAMDDLKRDMEILATSGRDWAERTKRLAAHAPGLSVFEQGLIERRNGGWRITDTGRELLEGLEAAVKSEQELSSGATAGRVHNHVPGDRRPDDGVRFETKDGWRPAGRE